MDDYIKFVLVLEDVKHCFSADVECYFNFMYVWLFSFNTG